MTIDGSGFFPERFVDIRDRMIQRILRLAGPSIDGSDGSLLGQVGALASYKLSQVLERVERLANVRNPDGAGGANLDSVLKLVGLMGRTVGVSDAEARREHNDHVSAFGLASTNNIYKNLVLLTAGGASPAWYVWDVFIDTKDDPDTLTSQTAGTLGAGVIEIFTQVKGGLGNPGDGTAGDKIADVLRENLTGGVLVESTGTAIIHRSYDSKGIIHTFELTAATQNTVNMTINVTTNSDYPSDGDTLVKDAAMPQPPFTYEDPTDTFIAKLGYPVIVSTIACQVLDLVPGIDEIEVLVAIDGGTKTPFDIEIARNACAVYKVSEVTVVST